MTIRHACAHGILLAALACVTSTARAGLTVDYSWVDRKSDTYQRFKGWVDAAVSGSPGYEFSAIDAVTMF
jgi:hypothetical protein